MAEGNSGTFVPFPYPPVGDMIIEVKKNVSVIEILCEKSHHQNRYATDS
jgi:hypothetical protein